MGDEVSRGQTIEDLEDHGKDLCFFFNIKMLIFPC